MNTDNDYEQILKNLEKYKYEDRILMRPFVGECAKNGSPLFLIGESHYLPEESQCDASPDTWYMGRTVLDAQDAGYLETDALIRDEFLRNGDFNHKPYRIWKNCAEAINAGGMHFQIINDVAYANMIREVFSHVIFFNYFRRPAQIVGGSLEATQIDYGVSKAYFDHMIEQFKPCAIAVVSKKAGYGLADSVVRMDDGRSWRWYYRDIPVVITAHPGCRWWNKPVSKYGKFMGKTEAVSGKMVFQEFIARLAPSVEWMRIDDDGK